MDALSPVPESPEGHDRELLPPGESDPVIKEAMERFERCQDWENGYRGRFIEDVKFANGDSDNGYQWPSQIKFERGQESRPCLTMNVIRQHNLQIVNDAKQVKSSVAIRAVGGGASMEAAQVYEAIKDRIEYQSDAQSAYAKGREFQVCAGIGYWRVVADYCSASSMDQDLFIRPINDPLMVFLDPDIEQFDGSDARFGFVFDDVPKKELEKAYPRLKRLALGGGSAPLGSGSGGGDWEGKDYVRVCEYFRKTPKEDTLVSFVAPGTTERKTVKKSLLPDKVWRAVSSLPTTKTRETSEDEVEWYLIVGQRVVDSTLWPGRYIPLVRCVGEETIIDGQLDRKGHTRALKDAQKMYNYNAPLALSTRIPTPIGWSTMGEVKVGDQVFDEFGRPTEVIGVSQVHQGRPCFKLTFTDGSHIVSDAEHFWSVEEKIKRASAGTVWGQKVLRTSQLVVGKHFVDVTQPLELADAKLPIPPYVMGLWLGDGRTAAASITSGARDVEETKALVEAAGCDAGKIRMQPDGSGGEFTVHDLRKHFTEIELLKGKYVPIEFLRGSRRQREALLQGMMDSDGCFNRSNNQCIFVNNNPEILSGFRELLASLGIKSSIEVRAGSLKKFPGGNHYQTKNSAAIMFTTDPWQQTFRLSRKRAVHEAPRATQWRRTKRFGLKRIEPVESVPVRCITVASSSHLFLAGDSMIPTHNSAQVEFGALQGKTPWVAPVEAIEGYEQVWNTANVKNYSVLPYNGVKDSGEPIAPPARTNPPTASPLFEAGMQTAFNQMMMVSGQWQNQMGMGGNERTGSAIEKRQSQGDTATFHFRDNYETALIFTGKILIDSIPRVYDTKRTLRIMSEDGGELDLVVDPGQQQALLQQKDALGRVVAKAFNPSVGEYDVRSAPGTAYGTRREATQEALTTIITQAPALTGVLGDILMKNMDFPDAQEAAARLRRMVPPQALGQGPTPQEAALQQHNVQLQAALAKALQLNAKTSLKQGDKEHLREIEVYNAETKRFQALQSALPLDQDGLRAVLGKLVQDALKDQLGKDGSGTADPEGDGDDGGLASPQQGLATPPVAGGAPTPTNGPGGSQPPIPGARLAPDGFHYLPDPTRPGKFLKVVPRGGPAQ